MSKAATKLSAAEVKERLATATRDYRRTKKANVDAFIAARERIQDRCPHDFTPARTDPWGFHEPSACKHCGLVAPTP